MRKDGKLMNAKETEEDGSEGEEKYRGETMRRSGKEETKGDES